MWPKYLKFCPSGKISPYVVTLQKRRTGGNIKNGALLAPAIVVWHRPFLCTQNEK